MHATPSKIEFLNSPCFDEFYCLVREAKESLTLCSPYIGNEPCLGIVSALSETSKIGFPKIDITTNLCRENLLSGATSADGLLHILRRFPETTIVFLPSLHAKVYIADDRRAIVTSANLTSGGLYRNVEYGVVLNGNEQVLKVRNDIQAFSSLGTKVSTESLGILSRVASELRDLASSLEKSTKRSLRQRFDEKLAEADLDVLRIRAAGRTSHAIFAEAILYLLENVPLTTAELNTAIQSIHPDLCDENVDRVIDGRHFGKKWKHGVRTAQVYLRRQGRIERHDQHWHLTR
jgi:hypothetical protein